MLCGLLKLSGPRFGVPRVPLAGRIAILGIGARLFGFTAVVPGQYALWTNMSFEKLLIYERETDANPSLKTN